MNTYVTLEALKAPSALDITGTGDDRRLLAMAEGVSRLIDRYCNRRFYVARATRRFDGNGAPRLLLPDLVRVDEGGVRTDDAGDGSFGTTWDAADYVLLPMNADPEGGGAAARPYTSIEVAGGGAKRAWPAGRGTVRIAGEWGWQRRVRYEGRTTGAVADASAGEVKMPGVSGVSAGHTLLIGAEQLFVRESADGTLKVDRGVNGTAASAHDAGAAVYVFEYPAPVVEAALLHTARLWRLASGTGDSEGGEAPDPGARAMLGSYRKPALGVG